MAQRFYPVERQGGLFVQKKNCFKKFVLKFFYFFFVTVQIISLSISQVIALTKQEGGYYVFLPLILDLCRVQVAQSALVFLEPGLYDCLLVQ